MKYIRPPMLSMNFSENKDGMKKRISNILSNKKKYSGKALLCLLMLCVLVIAGFVGCTSKDTSNNDNIGEKNFTSDIESAISKAILTNHSGNYLLGETMAEGHITLGTVQQDGNTIVYALTTYGEYGFENGIFTKISGTGAIPTKITLGKDDNGYFLIEYKTPEDGSRYTESIKEMFPDDLEERAIQSTEEDLEKCHQQEYQYAREYLKTINRTAEVNSKVEKQLANMNVTVSNAFIDLYHDYPYWIGTQEKIEHNVRFVYEKKWEDKGNGNGIVSFIKYRYDNKEVVEEYEIEINGEEITYLKGEARTTRAQNSIARNVAVGETVSVDLDGDGRLENIYYSLEDFRINGVSYKNDIEDVYSDNPNEYDFIVVDLDKADNQKEIVLKTEGPSNDPTAHFYTYKNGLIELGKAEAALNYTSFDGEGNCYGDVRLDILQTWYAPETWSLKDNKIIRNTDHIYYPNQYVDGRIILKEELPIHKELTDSSKPLIVKPQEVKITRTDNKQFCYLEAEDGTSGWFAVAEFFKIAELDNKIATEVFDGLCMAD